MSPTKRRFLERGPSPTLIGKETHIQGNVSGRGQYVVSGHIQGDGNLEGDLILAAGGVWHGHIQAENAVVAGEIIGDLSVKGKLEIGFTAVLRGAVSAHTLAIANGAIVDGEVQVTSGQPALEFIEKRDDSLLDPHDEQD